ncbi:uncharacterized protein LOC111625744 [Centruroides sculpturatus]|uniref:uncharacterized protein LOC111625744 n=1 Tax=Centruroides sculpturatus TaxID=218467 RepID=UPI000C6CF3C8|nr:uncharacterized protein LOC111625744 [Centruroides sculpturatus]
MQLSKLTFVGALTTVLITSVAILMFKKWRNRCRKIGRLSKIILYPVKSMAGLEVQQAVCKATGLECGQIRDRMWMLVKSCGNFLNPIDEPRLVSIQTRIEGDQLVIEATGMKQLRIGIISKITSDSRIIPCKMYKKTIEGVDCGDEAAEWFHKFLKKSDIRLIQYLPYFKTRPSEFQNLIDLNEDNYPLIYQAGNPYLILGQASLDELNSKLDQYISYRNFRPNIVIDECNPFEEDKWKYLKIGKKAVLIRTVPCERCSVTKINPEDGTVFKSEPLRTLKTFRISRDAKQKEKFGEKPLFGMQYGLVSEGNICVGDEIYVFFFVSYFYVRRKHVIDIMTFTKLRNFVYATTPSFSAFTSFYLIMEIPKFYLYTTCTAVLLSTLIYLGLRCSRKRFRKIGRVSKIILYPVKSLAGYEVEKAFCTSSGLKKETFQDRMWMLVRTSDNRNVTLMTEPRLVLLHPRIEDNQLIIDSEGLDPLKVDIITDIPIDADVQEYKIYEYKPIKGVDCGEEAAKWLQKFLNRDDIRLIQFLPIFETRPSTFSNLVNLNEDNYPVVFQSASPYLLLSQASVDDLNGRLEDEEKVSYKHFRANILLDDCKPFEEDKWKYLKIGEAILIRTIPCDRCAITKVNPETGIRSKEEPIRTLKKYRLAKDPKEKKVFGQKPVFTMNYGLVTGGEIWVGDEVYGSN